MARRHPDPKDESLRQHGSRNLRPEAVKDHRFRENEFFDPRDVVQVKYEMLRRVRVEGDAVAWAAADFGFSRPTFYDAKRDFESEGIPGLIPKKRGPKGGHKLTAEVVDFLRAARSRDPDLDTGALVQLVADRFGRVVHRRSIERAFARREKKRP